MVQAPFPASYLGQPQRKWLLATAPLLLLALAGTALFTLNRTPQAPPVLATDTTPRPYVVKIHAQWCPVCLMMKNTWSALQDKYAGRVHFVIFDITSKAATEASRAEAERLSLGQFFVAHSGEPGAVYVLDSARNEKDSLSGMNSLEECSASIDEALKAGKN